MHHGILLLRVSCGELNKVDEYNEIKLQRFLRSLAIGLNSMILILLLYC